MHTLVWFGHVARYDTLSSFFKEPLREVDGELDKGRTGANVDIQFDHLHTLATHDFFDLHLYFLCASLAINPALGALHWWTRIIDSVSRLVTKMARGPINLSMPLTLSMMAVTVLSTRLAPYGAWVEHGSIQSIVSWKVCRCLLFTGRNGRGVNIQEPPSTDRTRSKNSHPLGA